MELSIMVDDFLFAGDTPEPKLERLGGSWKVLIVDDEPEVHAVTKLALSDFNFQDKKLEFISAYSGKEAKDIMSEENDIAIVLLDVVMETDDAGLKVAEFIRSEMKNDRVRIILRTGQPGQAPEKQVIINYDINDYKSKTELTAQKLFTVVMSGLRSYRDIKSLETSQAGLKKIIAASADIFSVQSMEQFIDGVMQQLTSVLGCGEEQTMFASNSFLVNCGLNETTESLKIIAAQGKFHTAIGKSLADVPTIVTGELQSAFNQAIKTRSIIYQDNFFIAYCHSKFSTNSLLFVSGLPAAISQTKKDLVELFAHNVQIAYESIQLKVELEASQVELLERLGGAWERRPEDFGCHIKRVTALCRMLATWYGLTDSEVELLSKAAPLHDIGKIKLTEPLLTQDDELTEEQWKVVKEYPNQGYEILKDSDREMLQIAAIITKQHHERWDGQGYPEGLKGRDIHIYARIVTIADVYDSLRSKLAYKNPWTHLQALEYLIAEKGKQFDPALIELLIKNAEQFDSVFN